MRHARGPNRDESLFMERTQVEDYPRGAPRALVHSDINSFAGVGSIAPITGRRM